MGKYKSQFCRVGMPAKSLKPSGLDEFMNSFVARFDPYVVRINEPNSPDEYRTAARSDHVAIRAPTPGLLPPSMFEMKSTSIPL